MSAARQLVPPLAHLAIAASFIALSWWNLGGEIKPTIAGPAFDSAEARAVPAKIALTPPRSYVEELAEMYERPLFSEGRRRVDASEGAELAAPLATEAEDVLASPETTASRELPAPELRLLGILAREGDRAALVAIAPDWAEDWLRVGDEILGWKLQLIGDDDIVIRFDAQELTINLSD